MIEADRPMGGSKAGRVYGQILQFKDEIQKRYPNYENKHVRGYTNLISWLDFERRILHDEIYEGGFSYVFYECIPAGW